MWMFHLVKILFFVSSISNPNMYSYSYKLLHGHEIIITDTRIFHGNEAKPYQLPYQAALEIRINNKFICGAVIIKHNYVLTAAHCTEQNRNSLIVRAGTTVRQKGGYARKICRIIDHPDYDSFAMDFDISILKLCTPFRFSKFIQPIPLTKKEPPRDSLATISGWGLTESSAMKPSEKLKYAHVIVKDRNYCNQKLSITQRMICAEGKNGEDTCQGDSGGPLVINGKLVGLTSWGITCGKLGIPGVYTNIAVLKNFVKKHIKLK